MSGNWSCIRDHQFRSGPLSPRNRRFTSDSCGTSMRFHKAMKAPSVT